MKPSRRVTAILQAIFVTLLWSTSWVLIKIGLVLVGSGTLIVQLKRHKSM